MTLGQWVLNQKRLFFIVAILLTVLGVLSLFAVPKDEDPRMPGWFASVTVVLPGGDAEQIDEMIAKPLNDKLKEIDELKKVETTTRANVTALQLEMKDSVKNTKEVWDKVRNEIDNVKKDFPAGTQEPELIEITNRLETILYVVTGNDDILKLKEAALNLKQELLLVPGTSMVLLHGDPQDEIQTRYSQEKLEKLAIPHAQIVQKLTQANTGLPAGSIEVDGKKIPLLIPSRITNAKQVSELRLLKGSGDTVALSEVAEVEKAPRRLENRAYWNGQPALFLGVVAQHPIEIIKYGKAVRAHIQKASQGPNFKSVQIEEVSFNPDRTNERLRELGFNLLVGILTVGIILLFWMGWKIALVVSLFVPVISLVGFFFYSTSGGVLHQISLAAFVISLGQFIDNIIVIVEWMDGKIKAGTKALDAAVEAIDAFKKPMFFATGTNISAFIPMLASTGATAEFTFSIPLVSIMTMITAWAMALFVVPVFTGYLLANTKADSTSDVSSTSKFASSLAAAVARHPLFFSTISLVIMAFSSVGFMFVKKQFFPSADRNQLIVQIELDEGSSPKKTDAVLQQLTTFIKTLPEIQSQAGFIGEEVPRFYYNVGLGDWGSHTSKILITTKDRSENPQVIAKVQEFAKSNLPQVFVLTKNLEQGPPIIAPIEYRVFHEDPTLLAAATKDLHSQVQTQIHLFASKNDLGSPLKQLKINVNLDLAERFGLTEDQLAITLLSATSGISPTKYFDNGKTKDVRLIGKEISSLEELYELPVRSNAYRNLKLKDLADIKEEYGAAVIHRFNGARMARILGWPEAGQSANQLIKNLQNPVAELQMKHPVRIGLGGEVEGSDKANFAILKSIPLGLFVLILCLLLEFNSIRKMLIILLSVPFVIAGVTPGLLIGNAAFGFMSLLGVLALVGIVVNNSILLIESIDEERARGFDLETAITSALQNRTRPILLTAITTIAGLLPMAFEESTLWPPLAWAMISGLIGSTLITLVFVPSLYILCFRPHHFQLRFKKGLTSSSAITSIIFVFLLAPKSEARVYTFNEALTQVEQSSALIQASEAETQTVQEQAKTQRRAAFMPKLGAQVEAKRTHSTLTQTNGFGTFEYGKQNQITGGLELSQPLLNLAEMDGEKEKLSHLQKAGDLKHKSETQRIKLELISSLLNLRKIKHTQESLVRLEKSLSGIENEVKKFHKLGLRGQSDLLTVQITLSENRTEQLKITNLRSSLIKMIQVHLPDFEDLNGDVINLPPIQQTQIRSDLLALESLAEAERNGLKAIRQGHLPTLEFKARQVYADQGLLDQKDWTETALVLKWALFEGGTRASRASAQAAEIRKAEKQLQATRAQIEAEKVNHHGDLQENEFRFTEAQKNLERAKKALAEDERNSKAGKVPLKDWLSSEIRLEQKKLEIETLKLDKIKLQYDDLYLNGVQL